VELRVKDIRAGCAVGMKVFQIVLAAGSALGMMGVSGDDEFVRSFGTDELVVVGGVHENDEVLFNKKKPFWKMWAEDLGSECRCAFHRRYGYVQFFNFDEAWISRLGSRLGSGTEYYGGVLSVAKQGFK
jgi:hypothetical protein